MTLNLCLPLPEYGCGSPRCEPAIKHLILLECQGEEYRYRLLLEQYKGGGLVELAGTKDHCIEDFYGVSFRSTLLLSDS